MDSATLSKIMQKLKGPDNYIADPYDKQSMYEQIADSSENLSPEDVAGFAGVESEFGKYDKPLSGGSARGEFQIMPNTLKYLTQRADDKGIPKESNPLREQARIMSELIPQHEEELSKTLGPDSDISATDIYVKHNLGAGMGKKLLKAKDNVDVSDLLPEEVISQNPSIYEGKTKSEVMKEIQKRLNKKSSEFKFEKRGPLDFLEE